MKSTLNVQYKISQNHESGVQAPIRGGLAKIGTVLKYSSSFFLKMPVLEQLVAVGMLPIPSQCPRVGQQVIFQWRVERLKEGLATTQQHDVKGKGILSKAQNDQVLFNIQYYLLWHLM